MTMASIEQAANEILSVFKTAWDTTGFNAVYENVREHGTHAIPATQVPWARVRLVHADGGAASLSGALATKRYRRDGFLTVQVFVPSGEGLSRARQLAKIVMDAYDGASTPGGAWFRNARLNEVGPDGNWFQVNVLVDFTYDEIK